MDEYWHKYQAMGPLLKIWLKLTGFSSTVTPKYCARYRSTISLYFSLFRAFCYDIKLIHAPATSTLSIDSIMSNVNARDAVIASCYQLEHGQKYLLCVFFGLKYPRMY